MLIVRLEDRKSEAWMLDIQQGRADLACVQHFDYLRDGVE